ncbi:hypothetical protein STEG23_033584, partial [Scotinomys teguina]
METKEPLTPVAMTECDPCEKAIRPLHPKGVMTHRMKSAWHMNPTVFSLAFDGLSPSQIRLRSSIVGIGEAMWKANGLIVIVTLGGRMNYKIHMLTDTETPGPQNVMVFEVSSVVRWMLL